MKVYNFAQFRRRPFRVSFAKFGPQGTLDPSLVPQDLSAPRNFRWGKKMGLRDFASPEVRKMSDDELTTIIADGKDKMPSYKKSMKPPQMKDLVGYIRSLAKK